MPTWCWWIWIPPYTVDKDKLHSKSHNTPFDGAELYGKVCATIKGGKLTYQAEN